MKNRILILALGLLLLPAFAGAQEDTRRHLVVPLSEGGFVGFKSETAWAGATRTSAAVEELRGVFRSQAFVDENQVIHRVLVDAAGRYVFGYDLVIQPAATAKMFTIAVKPLDAAVESKLLKTNPEVQPPRIATLPQATEPQILADGDSFALDLLVNQATGVKIVDFVRVSFDRSNLWDDNPRTLPRDFTLDAVALTLADYRLLIDGNLVAAGKPGTTFGGALVWCYVEGRGRFIFSLVPREGYHFQKVGLIKENKIEFTVKGNHYEWLSNSPILPNGGTWNLWVLHDPKYEPFGSQEARRDKKSTLDKWDESVRGVGDTITRIGRTRDAYIRKGDQAPPAAVAKRFKVMVGAADRVENLWPRNL